MPEIGIALIGFGVAGRVFHAPLIRAAEGLRLRAIVRRRPAAGAGALDVPVVPDAEAVLEDARIALVVVATPTSSHHELARRALLAGKHVVVDKPFTVTAAEGDELIRIARERGLVLSVFHNRRWDADFLTLRRLMDSGRLGKVIGFESRFDRYRPEPRPGAWRESADPGGGVLYDLGSHLIDQALMLFGWPQRVTASIRRERDFGAADDAFDLSLHYSDLEATLHAGMLVREPTPRFVIRGHDAAFVKFGLDPQEAALRAGAQPGGADWGMERPEAWGTLEASGKTEKCESMPGNYLRFYQNVRDAIQRGAELSVTPEQASAVISIIELALESNRRGEAVVADCNPL